LTAHRPVTGDTVVASFLETVDQHGPRTSTLTDNGRVYTARFGGGRNAFEYLLAILGVRQKHGSPGHPQTQGKIERFHQPLKRWLAAQPPATIITDLQRQLDLFREHYNEQRPYRALDRQTPGQAYLATPKALPANNGHTPRPLPPALRPPRHHRQDDPPPPRPNAPPRRRSRARRQTRPRAHRRPPHHAIELDTGEIPSTHLIEPEKSYWQNQQREPGRLPSSQN
jgi:hypothetical protein